MKLGGQMGTEQEAFPLVGDGITGRYRLHGGESG